MSASLASINDDALSQLLEKDLPKLGFTLPIPPERTVGRRMHPIGRPPIDVEMATLTRDANGILRWRPGTTLAIGQLGLRRNSRPGVGAESVVHQMVFEQIPPNQIGQALEKLDQWLTPERGLRRWNGVALERFDSQLATGKRVLLFIHGTFSSCDNNFSELQAAPDQAGAKMLNAAERIYDHILTFDHPTIGVSPPMNAYALALALRPAPASIDIVAHSRGGIVARWFIEAFAPTGVKCRAVLVGSTIGGTSLAAPHRLKATLNYLATLGDILGRTAGQVSTHPFIGASAALTRVLCSVVRFTADAPILDAAVAMIPGIAGQSRVGNNAELLHLRSNRMRPYPEYYAVIADFEPEAAGWNVLQYFRKPVLRVADVVTDWIFDGPNDLVADTAAMTDLADTEVISTERVLDFGKSSKVYHTNYYRQVRTIDFIRSSLGISNT